MVCLIGCFAHQLVFATHMIVVYDAPSAAEGTVSLWPGFWPSVASDESPAHVHPDAAPESQPFLRPPYWRALPSRVTPHPSLRLVLQAHPAKRCSSVWLLHLTTTICFG